MNPEQEKKTEQEVRAIMMRWVPDLPEWDDMTKRERCALFNALMEKKNVIWDSFSFQQKRWVLTQLGFWGFLSSPMGGNSFIQSIIVYYFIKHGWSGCGCLIFIVLLIGLAIAIVAYTQGLL